VLLCLRDGVKAVAGHESEVADFRLSLLSTRRALQDIAPLIRAGSAASNASERPPVSASLQSAFDGFHADIKGAMEDKAGELAASTVVGVDVATRWSRQGRYS